MKLRSFFYALVAGAVVLLLIAAGGFFWLTSHSPLNLLREGALKTPTAAIFVPKQAPAMVSLLVNPDRLTGLRQLLLPKASRRRSRAELTQLANSLLVNLGLDYQRDIQPWVGDEITLAVTSLDFDRDRNNAAQPGYLLVFTTKDPEKARESLQLFYSRQAIAGTADLVFEQYNGVSLVYKRPLPGLEAATLNSQAEQNQELVTSAVVGDRFVLVANHPKVLRNAINNVQAADLNLANDPEYQQMLQSLTEPRLGISFVNLPALAAWISEQPLPMQDSFQADQTLTIALGLARQGLVAQTAVLGSESTPKNLAPLLDHPVEALQYIPAQSALAIAGTDLNQLWQRFSPGIASDDLIGSVINQAIANWQSHSGIKLPEDVFKWVQGEYALALLPQPNQALPDWIFVAGNHDSANKETSIKHLDQLAEEQGLSVGKLPLGDRTITAWTKLVTSAISLDQNENLMSLEAKVQGLHATMGNYEIFTTSIEAMEEALKGLDNSVLTSENFQGAIAPLPVDNDGYLYLDWLKSKTLIESQLPIVRVLELVGKPLFDHLRSLSISSYGIDQGVQRSKLFLELVD